MIHWVFRERGPHRVEWWCATTNERSIAAAKRLGMTLDGVLREAYSHLGIRHDVQIWSLLASAYDADHGYPSDRT